MFPAGSGPLGNETNILYGNMSFNGALLSILMLNWQRGILPRFLPRSFPPLS